MLFMAPEVVVGVNIALDLDRKRKFYACAPASQFHKSQRATRRKFIAQYGQPLFGKCAHCNTDAVYIRQFEKLAAGSQIVCTTCAYQYTFEDRHLNRASYSLGRMISIL
jgi:hypothetical protein